MASRIISRKVDLRNAGAAPVASIRGVRGEAKADTWRVILTDGGAAANLTGWTAYAQIIRHDGTMQIAGTISGNTVEVIFPQAAYAYAGVHNALLWIVNASTGAEIVVDGAQFMVESGASGAAIDPGTVVPTLSQLLAQLSAAQTATSAANSAATNANSVAAAVDGRVTALETGKADKSTTYTKAEVDSAIAPVASQLAESPNYRKATGNPARFYPVPASSLAVKALLTAIQAGSGDPSPTNIRAISPAVAAGGTVKAKRSGKNLLPNEFATQTANNVVLTKNSDGSISAVGTATASISRKILGSYGGTEEVLSIPPGTYTVPTTTGWALSIYRVGETTSIFESSVAAKRTVTLNERLSVGYVGFYIASGTVINTICYPQLEAGDVATPYEPYAGNDYTLTAQQAKYGLPGAEAWIANDGSEGDPTGFFAVPGTVTLTNTVTVPGEGYCAVMFPVSLYPGKSSSGESPSLCSMFTKAYLRAGMQIECFWDSGASFGVCVALSRLAPYGATSDRATHPAAAKAWLAALEAAGNPLQIVYMRATPTTAIGAAVSIPAIAQLDRYTPRQNVVTLDKGMAEVGYAKSPIRESDELRAAITALGGTINV